MNGRALILRSDKAVWIPGYWEWNVGQRDFVWTTGTWRNPPPGRFWVNGYWKRDDQGWFRVAGFWSDRQTDRIDWRKDGPPTDHPADDPGASPGNEFFYVPGFYAPDGDGVTWKKRLLGQGSARLVVGSGSVGPVSPKAGHSRTATGTGPLKTGAPCSPRPRFRRMVRPSVAWFISLCRRSPPNSMASSTGPLDGRTRTTTAIRATFTIAQAVIMVTPITGAWAPIPAISTIRTTILTAIPTMPSPSAVATATAAVMATVVVVVAMADTADTAGALVASVGSRSALASAIPIMATAWDLTGAITAEADSAAAWASEGWGGYPYYGYGLGFYPGYYGGSGFGGFGLGFGLGLGLGYGYGGFGGYGGYGYGRYGGYGYGRGYANGYSNGVRAGEHRVYNNAPSRSVASSRTVANNMGNRNSLAGNGAIRGVGGVNANRGGGMGNRANLASNTGSRGVMAPASSHAYANPYRSNTQTANRGVASSVNHGSTSFNGVHQSNLANSAARPASSMAGVNGMNRGGGGGIEPGRNQWDEQRGWRWRWRRCFRTVHGLPRDR